MVVADAVSERPPALVRHLAREDAKPLELVLAGIERSEVPVAAQVVWADREVRRRHRSGQHARRLGTVLLSRDPERDPRIRMIGSAAERQALDVIPMQVREHDRARERSAAEQRRQLCYPGASVEHQRRRRGPGLGERDTRRVATVA